MSRIGQNDERAYCIEMRRLARFIVVWLFPVIVLLAVLSRPFGLPWLMGVPEVSPADLVRERASASPPLVLDVRREDEYRQGHVPGAQWVPLGQVGGYLAAHPVPTAQTIVTVCAHGRRSAAGAAEIAAFGHERVRSLAGGTAAWQASGLPIELASTAPPSLGSVRVVAATWFEQLVTVLTAFVVKPVYMLLALALGLWLVRRDGRDLVLLGRGMLLFFVGETLCFVRATMTGPGDLLEMGHGLGMVAMGAWLSWGGLELVDRRVLGFSDPSRACVLGRLCQRCWKRESVSCGLHRTMRFLLPVLALLCLVPLSAVLRPKTVDYAVFGTLVRDEATPVIELLQMRLFPLYALWLFAVAFVDLRRGREGLERAKAPFAVAVGLLLYALLRFFLEGTFGDAVFWANAWEEVTELLTVLTLIWVLRVFRLGKPASPTLRASLPADAEPSDGQVRRQA
jgi:rhodanese-related sulfurtransferase